MEYEVKDEVYAMMDNKVWLFRIITIGKQRYLDDDDTVKEIVIYDLETLKDYKHHNKKGCMQVYEGFYKTKQELLDSL